jgi:hypothetical protein
MFQAKRAVFLACCVVCATSFAGCGGCGKKPVVDSPTPKVQHERHYGAEMERFSGVGNKFGEGLGDSAPDGLSPEAAAAREGQLQKEATARNMTLKQLILLKAEVRSLGRPWGKGQTKKLKPFKYLYVEVPPYSVKAQQDLVRKAADLYAKVEGIGIDAGKPFLLLPEVKAGWLFGELLRVCVPVSDETETPAGLNAARFDSTAVYVEPKKMFFDNTNLDELGVLSLEMRTKVPYAADDKFKGPYMFRFPTDDLSPQGDILWDWVIPID